MDRIEFGHSFGTVKKQGRDSTDLCQGESVVEKAEQLWPPAPV